MYGYIVRYAPQIFYMKILLLLNISLTSKTNYKYIGKEERGKIRLSYVTSTFHITNKILSYQKFKFVFKKGKKKRD